MKRLLFLATLALPAFSQFVPPVPKRLQGSTELTRRGPIPLPAENQEWMRVESERFTIISSAGEARTRTVARNLEGLASSLGQVNERFDGGAIQTQVLLFGKRRDCQAFFDLLMNRDRTSSPGAFVEHGDGTGTMVVDATREWNRTIFHELIHNLLSSSGADLPPWLEEGIAEYFSTAEFRGQDIVVGKPIREHQRLVFRQPLKLSDVISASRQSPLTMHTSFYPSSWATVEWLVRTNRAAFYPLVADIERGMPSAAAIRKHYRVDPIVIERSFRRILSNPIAVVRVEASTPAGMHVTPISRAEALREIGTFLGKMEVTAPDAERFFDEAMALEPRNGRAIAALGALRARQREFEKAYALYEKALAASPDDPQILLAFSEALMQNLIGQFAGVLPVGDDAKTRIRRARDLATRALHRGGNAAVANAIIGTSYIIEPDVRPGIPPLEKAIELRPGRSDIALNLYMLYLRSGDRSRGDELYRRRFAESRDPQVTFAAKSVFVHEQLRRVNELIRRNELGEVRILMKELISMTSDPTAKMELQNQLMRIEQTAEVNGHIMRYNEAVGLTLSKPKAALQIIEDLLKVAKDEAVLADATRLKEELEWRIRRAARK